MWLCLFDVRWTAHWSSSREPCKADFHRVERRLVRVWRNWHEATVFL